ncbi:hypothetical protein B0I72DRAFT_134698 [Yarrowia lipolytica]|uniref:Uncharacterized protein n=1 Tax=Yarrowia lipolytica TaxID=4952 RepID=A0A371CB54_YARLL|nr:hypothetical protein BKA90DRAFT_132363 [Yarrowia lipolytica]RDW27531.1 hypothetical protein B0I71DRAFT_128939 [Yarrowia lipolytica]RDW34373.1 hypothetical protein B0I72DRAFT_134698 [Yarrowia lipolytica]RDW44471.1 hypothetical protein B0I74DRAFT_140350 [Yarrowia lipolytica]RDW51438.1 hypothetical protein B0I75DRAFT_139858 [Yarrowia lipolytica]
MLNYIKQQIILHLIINPRRSYQFRELRHSTLQPAQPIDIHRTLESYKNVTLLLHLLVYIGSQWLLPCLVSLLILLYLGSFITIFINVSVFLLLTCFAF